jgi:hypothetical protein
LFPFLQEFQKKSEPLGLSPLVFVSEFLELIGLIMNDIKDKARELKKILAKLYNLHPCAKIEQAPPISQFLLNRLEEKRFKQQFRMH